ncbi:MAG TPA: hypothetical protein VH164_16835 [Ktedonobacteraceae bacterium]|nr:hypothetical protein [Ktedonobacteraceae bacterium]
MTDIFSEVLEDIKSGVALKRIENGMAALNAIKAAMAAQQLPPLAPLLLAVKDFTALAQEVAGMLPPPNPPKANPPA